MFDLDSIRAEKHESSQETEPADMEEEVKTLADTFHCSKLGCSGVTYNTCLTRQQSKLSDRGFLKPAPKFPLCATCKQGAENKAMFPDWKYQRVSKRHRPDRIYLKKKQRNTKKVELPSKKSASEMKRAGITPDNIGDSTILSVAEERIFNRLSSCGEDVEIMNALVEG